MKFEPIYDRVLVKREKEPDKTAGGIFIPETAKEKPIEAVVVAIGKGRVTPEGTHLAMEVAVGDKVLYGKFGGTEVKIDGEEHLILREDEIMGIFRD